MSLCECGCGREVKPGNRFIRGHNGRLLKHSDETKKLISESTTEQWKNPKVRKTMINSMSRLAIERLSDPEVKKRISKRMIQFYIDNPEAKEAAKLKAIGQWADPEAREAARLNSIQWHKEHPEWKEKHSKQIIKKWAEPEFREMMTKIRLNSEAAKIEYEKMRGGNDICNHHYIYDHSDLTKNVVKMTRSDHGHLHQLLQKLGYIVPHINGD